jgi:hypothetical protein
LDYLRNLPLSLPIKLPQDRYPWGNQSFGESLRKIYMPIRGIRDYPRPPFSLGFMGDLPPSIPQIPGLGELPLATSPLNYLPRLLGELQSQFPLLPDVSGKGTRFSFPLWRVGRFGGPWRDVPPMSFSPATAGAPIRPAPSASRLPPGAVPWITTPQGTLFSITLPYRSKRGPVNPPSFHQRQQQAELRLMQFNRWLTQQRLNQALTPSTLQGNVGPGVASEQANSRNLLAELAAQYQAAQDRANLANELRYQQLIGGHWNLYGSQMGMLAGLGQPDLYEAQQRAIKLGSIQAQQLTERGLAGVSTVPVVQRGVARDYAQEIRKINQDLVREALGRDAALRADLLRVVEARQDVGPDYRYLIELAKDLGKIRKPVARRARQTIQPVGLRGVSPATAQRVAQQITSGLAFNIPQFTLPRSPSAPQRRRSRRLPLELRQSLRRALKTFGEEEVAARRRARLESKFMPRFGGRMV